MGYYNSKLDDFEKYLSNKKVAIIGLGISNIPMLDYLYKLNAKVSIFDKKGIEKFDESIINKIKEYDFAFYTGENSLEKLNGFD